MGFAKKLCQMFTHYNIPHEIKGYPNYSERLEIIDSKLKEANSLSILFKLATYFKTWRFRKCKKSAMRIF